MPLGPHSLSAGRAHLAIPGPSVMPDRVLNAMHRAAPNIYGAELAELVAGLIGGLKQVARTQHEAVIYIANGHGAWEAALSNVIAPGERVLSLCTGNFGLGWAEMTAGIGGEVQRLDFGRSDPVDPDRVETLLRQDPEGEIKAVLLTHVDTATSVRNDVAAVRAAIDAAGHPALLMVDCIASLGVDRFEMDAWGADVMVGASQKGMMVPPGLGFVFYNDRAQAKRAAMPRVSPYWDWQPRRAPDAVWKYFGGTPPTHHLFGLRAALDMIDEEGGIEAVWARQTHLARAIWAAVDAWSREGDMAFNIRQPEHRSHAVTTLALGAQNGARLRGWTEQHMGVTLGVGLGMSSATDPNSDGYFRIGHMGHLNAHMVAGTLAAIEAGLIVLNIPHGAGALEAMARVLAEV